MIRVSIRYDTMSCLFLLIHFGAGRQHMKFRFKIIEVYLRPKISNFFYFNVAKMVLRKCALTNDTSKCKEI